MKKRLHVLGMIGTLLFAPIMASCSGGFFGNDGITISSYEIGENNKVTLHVLDENGNEQTIEILQGSDGKEGVGIENVETIPGNGVVTVKITLNDENHTTREITVPVRGIERIVVGEEAEEGGYEQMTIMFTDSSEPAVIDLPRGRTGVSISDIKISSYTDDVTGTTGHHIALYFDNAEVDEDGNLIPAAQWDVIQGRDGLDGTTITKFEVDPDSSDGNYHFTIVYSTYLRDENGDVVYDENNHPLFEESEQNFDLPVPIVSEFLSGIGNPTLDLGKEGDIYLDFTSGRLYKKEDGKGWVYYINLNPSSQSHTVTFLQTDNCTFKDSATGGLIDGNYKTVNVTHGGNITIDQFKNVEVVNKDDSKKFIGWYIEDYLYDDTQGEHEGYTAVGSDYYVNYDSIYADKVTTTTVITSDVILFPRFE